MKGVDTNVPARFVLIDDAWQAAEAEAVLRHPVWVDDTVFLEVGWALGRKPGMNRAVPADALEPLPRREAIHTGNRTRLLWAVERFRAGADRAGVMHLVPIGRAAGPLLPVPMEMLA